MRFVMFEKTPVGYDFYPGAIFWQDECGDFHRKYGPAIINENGEHTWYNHGVVTKSMNIEDDDVLIEDLMKEFNFKKVHSVMNFMNWQWSSGGRLRIPTLNEIKNTALGLLDDVKKYRMEETSFQSGTGGFTAWASKDGFGLRFTIEEWGCF